ncbi:hypothetical protein YTPLAS18_11770 [Nitrospira sp.]|nr:hypothetical protein YTPLAS18_11770 [Nitrospira sp.]
MVRTMRAEIARLTGHESSVKREQCAVGEVSVSGYWATHRMSLNQLNEMLLSLAYETISPAFFSSFFGKASTAGVGRSQFEYGLRYFEQIALLKYGNVKFGFKTLAKKNAKEIKQEL